MSFKLYDEALKEKITSVFDNFIMAPPEQAFTRSNEEGKVKLPLISAYRMSNPINFEDYNHYETMYGRQTLATKEGFLYTQGVPVTITYQVDIWAQLREYADGLYRELVYYFMQNPDLSIKLPNTEQEYKFFFKLTDVETATDYESFSDKNVIHRYTLTYEIDEARMFYQVDKVPFGKRIIEFVDV